ncbi:MAG: hypothetical protein SPE10_07850 [Paludibacteraceae bacterium]|nr:hypothetical protein [Paludibacteraceae bacterium]
MMKHTKHLLVLWAALLLGAGNAWGADVTYTFSTAPNNPGNAQDWLSDDIDAYTSWAATKGGTNNPKYYNTGTGLRVYNGGTFTITSSKTIATITLTFSGTGYTFSSSNTTTPQSVSPNATSYAWSVSRTCRLQKIEITYETGTSPTTLYLGQEMELFWNPARRFAVFGTPPVASLLVPFKRGHLCAEFVYCVFSPF